MTDFLKLSGGDCYIDPNSKMIHTPGRNVFLSEKEFELFLLLFDNPETVFSKEEVFTKIWGSVSYISTVAVHIMRIRRKLEQIKQYMGTIENGYAKRYFLKPPRPVEPEP